MKWLRTHITDVCSVVQTGIRIAAETDTVSCHRRNERDGNEEMCADRDVLRPAVSRAGPSRARPGRAEPEECEQAAHLLHV